MLINFANPEAANHVEKEIRHVIEDYRLDFYKTDYNNRIPEGGQGVRDGYLESEEWRHYEILYAIYEQVLKDHPEIVLENCAGGGGRLDMGMMSHFHYGCESDWSVMPFSIRAINALTFFLPPESLCYYHNHIGVAHQQAELDTHLRVTLFALPIFVGFGAQNASRDSEYFMRTRYYIDLHKTFCRHVLGRSPVVYHHTPDIGLLKPANWCVLEYALADRNQGYIGVFKIGDQPSEKCYQLRFKGVDPARDYKIEMDNNRFCFHAHGSNLMMEGIRIELDHAGLSELVLYTVMT
jgi:alpha-galactosidase